MHKLCSLKDLTPGSVIELPKDFASREAETAVILGLEYASDKKHIHTQYRKEDGTLTAFPSWDEDHKLKVVDDEVLTKSTIQAFVTQKLALPSLGMSCGCDPEVFVLKGNGEVFPAWEYMPSKEEARAKAKEWRTQTFDYKGHLNRDFSLENAGTSWEMPGSCTCPQAVPAYWDGAQAEFAPFAKSCLETLHYGTREGLKSVLAFARAKDPLAKLTLRNVVELPESTLKTADDKFVQFRCSRSYNVYNDPGDGVPNAREYKWRCAGGHIHVGFTRTFTAPGIEQIVRGLDAVLGTIGVSLAAGIDNPERRHTYGRAGEFRLPQHGLEYRVLSNFWLSHPAIAMLVFEISRAAVRLAQSGLYNLCWVAREDETREVINNCDVEGARNILRRNAAVLSGMLKRTFNSVPHLNDKMCALSLKTIMNGIGVAIKDPFDIEGNWKINNPEAWKYHCLGTGDSWKSLTEGTK